MKRRKNPTEDAYWDWRAMQPRGKFASDAEAYEAFYELQSEKMYTLNQSATLAGQRAAWAWRKAREAREESYGR